MGATHDAKRAGNPDLKAEQEAYEAAVKLKEKAEAGDVVALAALNMDKEIKK